MKVQLQFDRAERLAEKIIAVLSDTCERIHVAGSIRRRCATVGDVELVAIPRRLGLLAGLGASCLDTALDGLVTEGRLTRVKNGERYKQFAIGASAGLMLDLFIVTPETWGVQFALRTGPADFSRALVTQRDFGGRLDNGLVVFEGRVWRRRDVRLGLVVTDSGRGERTRERVTEVLPGAVALDTPEEIDFLQLAGGWYEPPERAVDLPIQSAFAWGQQV